MTTLANEPAARTPTDADDPQASARAAAIHLAPVLLLEGITSGEIRELGASRPSEGVWLAVADEMDAIASPSVPAQGSAPVLEEAPA